MQKNEFISPEGLRVDGRRAGEVRRLRCKLGPLADADGSAYVEQGNTKVLVRVTGPKELTHRLKAQHDRVLLTCEFSALPFAGGQYRPQGRSDRNAAEIAMCVRQVLEPVVQAHLYPRGQIDIAISVLESDGDVRAAAINATSLAMVDAGVAMEDLVCACSAGIAGSSTILDLNGQEAGGCAEMVVALLPRTGRLRVSTSTRGLEFKHPATCAIATLYSGKLLNMRRVNSRDTVSTTAGIGAVERQLRRSYYSVSTTLSDWQWVMQRGCPKWQCRCKASSALYAHATRKVYASTRGRDTRGQRLPLWFLAVKAPMIAWEECHFAAML
eukprot:scaffold25710_cov32-Tisochrysis_lutea.AAC.2